jgi:hypothetical protein
VTKEKNKSVQFKSTATMNADTARLCIGTVPHLPPAIATDLKISLSEASVTKVKKVSSVQMNSDN